MWQRLKQTIQRWIDPRPDKPWAPTGYAYKYEGANEQLAVEARKRADDYAAQRTVIASKRSLPLVLPKAEIATKRRRKNVTAFQRPA